MVFVLLSAVSSLWYLILIHFSLIALIPLIATPLAIVGFIDDFQGLPASCYVVDLYRIFTYIRKSSFSSLTPSSFARLLPFIVFVILLVLATAVINFINFLDGIDGLVSICMIVSIFSVSLALSAPGLLGLFWDF